MRWPRWARAVHAPARRAPRQIMIPNGNRRKRIENSMYDARPPYLSVCHISGVNSWGPVSRASSHTMSFSQKYQQLPTVDKDAGEQESLQRKDPRKRRFPLLVIAIIMIMCVSLPCVRMIRSRFWPACHSPQRTYSSLTKLPSHYTLPSGDKIPSVALGTVNCSSSRC